MSNKKQQNIMSIDSLIVLSHILDDYEKFDRNIKKIIEEQSHIKVSNTLSKISKSKNNVGGRTVKEFYLKNKDTVDTINKYSSINSFLYYNENWHKNNEVTDENKYNLDYFYNYFSDNKENLEQIKSVLSKLRKIGIKKINLNEELDFTNNVYEVDRNYKSNNKLYYLDNIVIIPNYDKNKVKFKTIDSPYEISTIPAIDNTISTSNRGISKYNTEIKLNTLNFNKDRIPNELNKAIIFDKLIYLKRQVQDLCNNIVKSIDLSININELKEKYNEIVNNIANIDLPNSKDYIYDTLINISENIKILEIINDNYKDNIVNNSNISKKEIDDEQDKVLKLTLKNSNH